MSVTGQYDQELKDFTDAMRYKLHVNKHRGKWNDVSIPDMLKRLRDEVDELEQAIAAGNHVEIMLEAADVGNFALIISNVAVRNMASGMATGGIIKRPVKQIRKILSEVYPDKKLDTATIKEAEKITEEEDSTIKTPLGSIKVGTGASQMFLGLIGFVPQGIWTQNGKIISTMWKHEPSNTIYYSTEHIDKLHEANVSRELWLSAESLYSIETFWGARKEKTDGI